MAWHHSHDLVIKALNRRGLGATVIAGQICQELERLSDGLCSPISVRNQVLHIRVSPANLLAFKMQEGRFLKEINVFAKAHALPAIARFRLTIAAE